LRGLAGGKFDEFHFSQFVDDYAAGRYLFDIHPPLAKLLLYAAGWLGGYVPAPDDYKFDMIGKEFGNMLYVPQRTLAATFGSLIPATLYLTCRALGVGVLPALTAASLSVTDTLLLIESRLVLTDSQLIFYIQAALLCALMLWRTSKRTAARRAWLVATSVFGGCAISTKWTALVVPAMIALVSLTGAIFPLNGERLEFAEMAVAGCIAISIYVASFYAHFKLLPLSGPGDLFMPCWFRRHLVGQSTCTDSSVEDLEPLSFIRSFVYLNKEMYRANSQIEQRHHWVRSARSFVELFTAEIDDCHICLAGAVVRILT
jgi:dolichyl-phosphate-mannose-protein mannosyltransferase